MANSILLIYNPGSGYFIENRIDEIEAFFSDLVHRCAPDITLNFLTIADFADADLAALLDRIRADRVWVAGGDGSVISVATALPDEIALGILPLGTMNLLARDVGISLDIKEAVAQLIEARAERIDLACMNDKPYLCLSNIGMSTKLTALREALRGYRGWLRWPLMFFYMLRFIYTYPTMEVEIIEAERRYKLKTRSISISNNRLSTASGLIPVRKRLNRGKLGIYVIKDRSLWSLPRMVLRLLYRDWFEDPDLLSFEASEVVIRFKRYRKIVSVMCDGELSQETTPLEYSIRPLAITLLHPK